ncbi:MAG TPA: hypothetical protein VMG30_01445 [Acidobacteriota bacterium]|nr:hypothetical protein [Acidobacteriota bacterium]
MHVLIAFDWGDEVDLEQAKRLVRAEEHKLLRRSRTPSSIAYKPAPLTISLDEVPLELPEIGPLAAIADATVFDFAGVSVDLKIPFSLTPDRLLGLAGYLAEGDPLVIAAKSALEPLYRKLLPAIQQPLWSSLSEDYFVFLISPGPLLPTPATLLDLKAGWVAGLVRMETSALSSEEISEAVRLHLSYSPEDLFVPDWAAAVLIDRDCDETLQTIQFVNLLLLEFRHLDERLAIRLAAAYKLIQPLVRSRLPLWHTHHRSLRSLGELKMEANSMIERPVNVLKLVGDQYIARVYSLLAKRFHLEEWEQSIRRTLEVIEGAYGVISDQAATYRTEILEIIVIVLILAEIMMAIRGH